MSIPPASQAAPLGLFPGRPKPRLYDSIIEVLRGHHYNLRTERAYVGWTAGSSCFIVPAIRASYLKPTRIDS